MEKEKWKIRLCLILVVLAAFIMGFVYYCQNLKPMEVSEGVLISIVSGAGGEYGSE